MSDTPPTPHPAFPPPQDAGQQLTLGLMGAIESMSAAAEAIQRQEKEVKAGLDLQARYLAVNAAEREATHRAAKPAAEAGVKAAQDPMHQLMAMVPPDPNPNLLQRIAQAPGPAPAAAQYDPNDPQQVYEHIRGMHTLKGVQKSFTAGVQERLNTMATSALEGYTPTSTGVLDAAGEAVAPDDPNLVRAMGTARLAEGASRMFGAIGQGEGRAVGLNLLGSTGAKALGAVGLGYTVATQARDFALGQREANVGWQRTLGGSNAEAFGERLRSQAFEFTTSWFGGMGAGEAQKLYKGAADVFGTNRELRANAQNFGLEARREFGTSVEESLQLVRASTQAGAEDLEGLAEAIEHVRDVSREAGVNAQEAVTSFSNQVSQVGQFVSGSAVFGLAGATTASTFGLGHQFTGVQTSAYTSESQLQIQAATMGMTLDDYLAGIQDDPQLAIRARALQARQQIPASERVRATAEAAFQENNGPLNEAQRENLGDRLAQMGYNVTDQQAQSILTGLGETGPDGRPIPLADAPDRLLAYLTGEVYSAEQQTVEQAAEEARPRDISRGPARDSTAAEGLEALTNLGGGGQNLLGSAEAIEGLRTRFSRQQVEPSAIPYLADEMGTATRERFLGAEQVYEDDRSEAYRQYARFSERQGQTSPLIEKLLGHPDIGSVRIEVDSQEGRKVVSADEAIRFYSDQLRAGTAVIVDSSNPEDVGQTVEEYTQVAAEDEASIDMHSAQDEHPDIGVKAEEFEREDEGDGGGGVVYLEATPELRRLIGVQGTSGSVDASNYDGSQPTPERPPDRPTG